MFHPRALVTAALVFVRNGVAQRVRAQEKRWGVEN